MKFAVGKKGFRHGVFHVVEKDEEISTAVSEDWAKKICAALTSFYEIQSEDDESGSENSFSVEPATAGRVGWVVRNQSCQKELIMEDLTDAEARKVVIRLNGLSDKGGE